MKNKLIEFYNKQDEEGQAKIKFYTILGCILTVFSLAIIFPNESSSRSYDDYLEEKSSYERWKFNDRVNKSVEDYLE